MFSVSKNYTVSGPEVYGRNIQAIAQFSSVNGIHFIFFTHWMKTRTKPDSEVYNSALSQWSIS